MGEAKGLLLITNGFPFGDSERGFLETEFTVLCQHFRVSVLAVTDTPSLERPVPKEVHLYTAPAAPQRSRAGALLAELCRREIRRDAAQAMAGCAPKKWVHRASGIIAYTGAAAAGFRQQLRTVVRQERVQIIYTYWCTAATVAALRLKEEFPRLKVVTRFHGYDLYRERDLWGWQPLRSWIAEKCDSMYFVSEQGRDYFLQTWGQQWAEKAHVAYLGCRAMGRVEQKNDGVLRLVSCSDLIPLKRVHLIIEALALLPDDMQMEWTHIGDGELRAQLEADAAKQLNGKETITWRFCGRIPNENLEMLYQTLAPDLFVTTSETEGLPISVTEAEAMGVPALATDVGGMREIVRDGRTGLLLPAAVTPEQIAAGIQRYAELPQPEKQNLREQAYSLWQQSFDAGANAERMAAAINDLLPA